MGTNIKPQVDRFTLKNGKNIILLAEGRLDALSEPTPKKHKTALPSVLRPTVFDPGFWTPVFGPRFLTLVFGPRFLPLVFGPSPLLPSDFAGASHFQLVHIHKIKSKWSLVILLSSRQSIRIKLI